MLSNANVLSAKINDKHKFKIFSDSNIRKLMFQNVDTRREKPRHNI